jgi:WD40 repeat protein
MTLLSGILQVMLGLDISGEVIAAECGADETILIWNSRTQRLLAQQLVGHSQQLNSVGFLKDSAQTVVTT